MYSCNHFIIKLAAIFSFLIIIFSTNYCHSREVRKYHRTFMGLQVCVSTLNDVVKVLGAPTDTKINSNNVLYKFENGVHVTIQNKTNKINTIIINNRKYKVSGNRVGDSRDSVLPKLSDYSYDSNTISDYEKGYTYWFKDGKVYRIVMGCKMVIGR